MSESPSKSPDHYSGMKGRFLKTLNDEILTKTQLAIKMVNAYQNRRNRIEIPHDSIIFANKEEALQGIHTNLTEDVDERVNLVGEGTLEYYKIDCRGKKFPIRLQFKHVRNSIKLYASFREKFPSEEACEYDIMINRDFRKSITPRPERVKDFMYICLEAMAHVGIMDMKICFYSEKLEQIREELRSKNMKLTLHPDKIEELQKKILQTQKSSKLSLPPMPTISTERSQSTTNINYLKKNQTDAGKFKTVHSSKKIIHSQKQISKQQEIKQRRQQIQVKKDKERELSKMATECKEIIQQYEERLAYQGTQKNKMLKDVVKFIMLVKFANRVNGKVKGYIEKFSIFAKLAMRQNKGVAKFKQMYKKAIQLMPNRKHRLSASLHLGTYLLASLNSKPTKFKANKLIANIVDQVAICRRVNESFDQATIFRRKLRQVQKFWKGKYHARLNLIKQFAKKELKYMLSQYPHFRAIEDQFYKTNQFHVLCVEYVKDIAQKFNQLYAGYLQTLIEIEDIIRMNEIIKDQNTRLLKKKQKQLLAVPHEPQKPFYRFFRDLDILKSMLRSWFEIQYKKMQKRLKKK